MICRECSDYVEVVGQVLTRAICPRCALFVLNNDAVVLFRCERNLYIHVPGDYELPKDAPLIKMTNTLNGHVTVTLRLLCIGLPPLWADSGFRDVVLELAPKGALPGRG